MPKMADRMPPHPGDVISERLADMKMTQAELASALKMMLPRLNEIINRKRKITSNVALRLARVLGTTPEYWMHLQVDWDLHQTALKNDYSDLKPLQGGNECQSSVANSA